MKHTVYYYGVTADSWKNLPYENALKQKINLGKQHLHYLIELNDKLHKLSYNEVANDEYNLYLVLDSWINDVLKAIEFNQELLHETKLENPTYPLEVELLLDKLEEIE
jgi:hypothetical protein